MVEVASSFPHLLFSFTWEKPEIINYYTNLHPKFPNFIAIGFLNFFLYHSSLRNTKTTKTTLDVLSSGDRKRI